ncbi:vacuolar protein sorting-associated protein 52 homolog [Octopus sinensis]|uniref:Vacuolar protein sorting-associated protein 52 homolog n=1 Tax=Octopus sinensis TaxID=2607531 RepID=A0A7E6F519_9MOLL|nr:vacuolar protein sorting-associated protein 52 homolog [Octopus sinensis]XP_036362824.1 vacuolar protein sorting-associated protein 52 homolog [Octopus sinensis]XP_036362827.1 vacuolar protein sorting-associated protein 52 homolog [Octopus sinensis]
MVAVYRKRKFDCSRDLKMDTTAEDTNGEEGLGNFDVVPNLGVLDLTSEDFLLDEVDFHIQQNLEDDIVKEALKTGVDLRQYSKQIEKELLEVENASIQGYIKESQNIASLHKQIAACDTILERMEQMLNGFQADLSSISNEIQTLQEQSIAMNIKLKNRQAVRGELSQFVDEMVIPESMVSHIVDTPVTEREFMEQLNELNHKINFVKEQSFKEARSCQDVRDILEKLKTKALSKIREYLLQKIYSFRKPMTNYQVPQNTMLKFRFFNEFLMSHERQVAKEIRDEYVDTMSKVYYSYFKGYTSRLMKLQYEELADKDDLMGIEDTAKKGFFSSKPSLKNRSTVFTVGDRGEVLTTQLEAPVIVPHAAQKNETRYTFEKLFRSQHYTLMDNCCREYLFVVDFFMVSVGSTAAQELFNSIMGKTLSMFLKHMEVYTNDCFDSIAIFLCIHIINRYRTIMLKRNVPALERYWQTLQDIMWPRFQYILELNIHSVKECDPQKLGQIDIRPHYITRRYAEFSAAIVGINQSYPDEKVHQLLGQLQIEVENFVLKMAAEFPQRKEQLVFLINNYDMMLNVIMERTEDSKECESFQELLSARTQEFIEEVLAPHFGGMVSFVKECEVIIEKGNLDALKNEERRVQQIVRGFNSDWKKAIEIINQDVMRSFTNFKNGTQILQGALTQLVQYYHRFQKVLSQGPLRNLQIRNELINIHHVMVEVKKHKPTF